jgi:YceI-like domain
MPAVLKSLATGGCLLLLAAPLRADDMVRFRASPIGSKVRIEGTSTIHDWTMTGQNIGGYLEVPASVVLDPARDGLPGVTDTNLAAKAEVSIPVTSMQSGAEGMDEAMQDAMNAATYPRIQYHLTQMSLKAPHAAGTPFEFDTKGELTVAGVTNTVSMPVRIESTNNTKLKVSGSIPLKMTSFKVTPPVKAAVFRTADDIKIVFEWVLNPPKAK